MEKKSLLCTVIIQCALCLVLYYTIKTGIHPESNHIYFISILGGFRPLTQQTHLLKQIERVINNYNVGFVINISELGEDDPLLQNATQYFQTFKAPWYTTEAKKGEEPSYIFKQVNFLSGTTLDIIGLNTVKIQDTSSGIEEVQLKQLSRKLELSNSDWHIAAGFHPLFCNRSLEQTKAKGNDIFYQMLLKNGVDAYLSGHLCANEAPIGGPYFTTLSQRSYPPKKTVNMFLLHRVTPLEIVTYGVSFKGDIIHESAVRQRGREGM